MKDKAECLRECWYSRPKGPGPFSVCEAGESGAVYALCAEHIGVIDLKELLSCEGLRGAEDHVPSIMNDDIETTVSLDDGFDCLVGGFLRSDVELDGAEVYFVLGREFLSGFHLRGVSACGFAHAGVEVCPAMARARAARAPKPLEAPVITMTFFISILLFFRLGEWKVWLRAMCATYAKPPFARSI